MRPWIVASCAIAAGAAAVVQLASTALYGDLARPPAVPPLVPPALGLALAAPLASPHAPLQLRLAYARALVHRGDLAGAKRIVATFPVVPATLDIRGTLAERSGDRNAALDLYAGARDMENAQRLIDELDRSGDPGAAGRMERRLAAELGGSGDAEVRAVALWRSGQIEAELAVREPALARAHAERAMQAYDDALTLAPNNETFLLAAGTQALALGDRAAAARFYRRALDAVPNSADARAGLARAAP